MVILSNMVINPPPPPQPKLYLSIIDDVIDSIRELFIDEGVEERVLDELRQVRLNKSLENKSTAPF